MCRCIYLGGHGSLHCQSTVWLFHLFVCLINKKLQNFGGKAMNAGLVFKRIPQPHCVQGDTSLYPIFKF